jgi:DNA mismatch repair ATPase MutS
LYEKEYNLFKEVSSEILKSFKEIKKISKDIANIDFISSLSQVAYENDYSKPQI